MKEKIRNSSIVRRLLSIIAAVVMTLGMVGGTAIPAMAYGNGSGSYTITIKGKGTEQGHKYKAYQIFAGDLHEGVLSNIVDGKDLATSSTPGEPHAALVTALKQDATIGSKFSDLQTTATSAQIAEKIEAIGDKSIDAIALAKVLKGFIDITNGGQASSEFDASNNQYTISGLAAGYYLVVDDSDGDTSTPAPENYSGLILEVVGDKTIAPKVNTPSIDKKITAVKGASDSASSTENILDSDSNDHNKGTAAAAQIGSIVSFEVTGEVPDLSGFSDYTYTITDTLSSGLDFVATSVDTDNVVVKINNGTALKHHTGSEAITSSECTVSIDGKKLTVTIPYVALKATGVEAGQSIVVTYDAKVNKDALTHNYEDNTATLTYSNNPENSASSQTTPPEKTYIVNVDFDIYKIKKDTETNKTPLPGAEFKLYKVDNDGNKKYYTYSDTDGVKWVDEVLDTNSLPTSGDTFKTTTTATGGIVAGHLEQKIHGLTAGTYYLVETKAPDGYNRISDNIVLTVTGTNQTADGKITGIQYSATLKIGTADAVAATMNDNTIAFSTEQNATHANGTVTIENASGSTLPSTGGIGTTIFYVIGGVVVAGAVILLLARRRKNA